MVNALELQNYFMVAHSSGVSPVVVSFKKLSRPPSHVCLISSRYDAGPAIDAEALLQQANENPGFLNVVRSVVLGFSPPSLSELI
ncbi:hypothetical protein [Candidatus Enterovibrio escicola]|uniref:hypothetical protein n=1 Tax=Candidatus Enterovibrio escicola TaxID=1927127 RepID=UPI0012380C60|nr:hypothetical protein [Candidatus Enterovibrio escacola]